VDRYRGSGQPIHLIGVEFSRERRTLVTFEVERLSAERRLPAGSPRVRVAVPSMRRGGGVG